MCCDWAVTEVHTHAHRHTWSAWYQLPLQWSAWYQLPLQAEWRWCVVKGCDGIQLNKGAVGAAEETGGTRWGNANAPEQ